jgi:hypothetical protein
MARLGDKTRLAWLEDKAIISEKSLAGSCERSRKR